MAVLGNSAVKVINNREYIVRCFFIGEKNIDEVLTRIAVSKAYEEIRNGSMYKKLEKNSLYDLAKSELI